MADNVRDEVLDRILGRKGTARKLRRIPDALDRALQSEGVKHKGIHEDIQKSLSKITDDPELQAKIHHVMAQHNASKAGVNMDAMPSGEGDGDEPDGDDGQDWGEKDDMGISGYSTKEEPEGDTEAEEEAETEDARGDYADDYKAQPGYEEMDRTNPVQVPNIVNNAITKRPGNFPKPVTQQERTGAIKSISDAELVRVIKSFDKKLSDLEAAMGEVAAFVEMQKTNVGFSPRQSSIAPETEVTDTELTKSVIKMNGRFDNFWNSTVQGGQ